MDPLTDTSRRAIKSLLSEIADHDNTGFVNADAKAFCVFDEERDQYLVVRLGWQRQKRVKGIVVHIRIQDGFVWIEENWTERPIATELTELGIRPELIVLGFQPPSLRVESAREHCRLE